MNAPRPTFADAIALYDRDQPQQAEAVCREILSANPLELDCLRMLGVLARDAGDFDRALEWLDQALRQAPENPVFYFERGLTRYRQGTADGAIDDYRRAFQLNPDFQEAALNLAAVLEQQERFGEALPWALRAIQLRPTCPKAHYNLGNIQRSLGHMESAVAAYQASLGLDPANPKAHWNLAHAYLLQGDFAHAWPEHEWRQEAGEVFFDRYPQPRWDGSRLAGRTLLVHAEQGVGDEVMFASCYDELIAQAAHCVLICDPRLEKLFARSFPRATVYGYRRVRDWTPRAVERPIDYQIPAGSVPLYLRRGGADFPQRERYLSADSGAVDAWRERYAALGTGLKVGISWRAGGRPTERRKRTTGLAEWLPLLNLAPVHWINLQYGDTIDELAAARRELGVEIHDFAAGDPLVDLDEFAAKTAALDLVVSVGNATVHMAGALGVPAWAVLPPVPGWRWQIAGSTSPWYSSVRLYRQRFSGGWSDVFQRLRSDLVSQMRSRGIEPASATKSQRSTDAAPAMPPSAGRPANEGLLRGILDAEQFSAQAVPAALAQALAHHQAGELEQAEKIYREVLNHLPRNIEAQRLLGLLARQTGRIQLAVSSLRRALAAGDDSAATTLHLAGSLRDAGEFADALATFQQIVQQFPDSAEAWLGQGKTLAQLFRPDEAIASLREAIRLDPALAEAQQALARLLLDDGLAGEALAACDRALAVRPEYLLARYTRALALDNLGRSDEAIAALHAAAADEPDNLPIAVQLAQFEQNQGRLAEAEITYRRALAIEGRTVLVLNNLGLVLQEQGRTAEALTLYDRALAVDPNSAAAHMNRALGCLELGRFTAGWREYQWRWRCPDSAPARTFFPQSAWDGSSLADRTILIHGEQSIEQEIVLATCLPDLVARAGQVAITCDPRLARLFARSFATAKVFGVARNCEHLWRPPAGLTIDVQAPTGDLPGHLRTALADFPPRSDYLRADPLRVAVWRRRLEELGPGRKVGIAWRVGQTPLDRLRRWVPLGHWLPLVEDARTQFVALQPGDVATELAECQAAGGRVHEVPGGDALSDVNERAALIAALDAVIAVGDINLHLAGALGTPAWGLFARTTSWPWLIHEGRVVWYPAVRVIRPDEEGDWSSPIERLAQEFFNLPTSSCRVQIEEGHLFAPAIALQARARRPAV